MPLDANDLKSIRERILKMLLDTIKTFEALEEKAGSLYGERAGEVKDAIRECLDDFFRKPAAGQGQPKTMIEQAPLENLERAGFYGAQLDLKERQVTQANRTLRQQLAGPAAGLFKRPFRKWVDIINNFLDSLIKATGLGEALKELKDCLRDELPED